MSAFAYVPKEKVAGKPATLNFFTRETLSLTCFGMT